MAKAIQRLYGNITSFFGTMSSWRTAKKTNDTAQLKMDCAAAAVDNDVTLSVSKRRRISAAPSTVLSLLVSRGKRTKKRRK